MSRNKKIIKCHPSNIYFLYIINFNDGYLIHNNDRIFKVNFKIFKKYIFILNGKYIAHHKLADKCISYLHI